MGPLEKSMREKLQNRLMPSLLNLENESHMHRSGKGAESHFKLLVVSDKFQGLSRVQRQRLIFEIVGQELKAGVHALSQRAYTSEEYKGQEMVSPACAHTKK